MHSENSMDWYGACKRRYCKNFLINDTLWNIDDMNCRNKPCCCFSKIFCILNNDAVSPFTHHLSLNNELTVTSNSIHQALLTVQKYFQVKGLLYFSARHLIISTQYLFLNSLESPSVHMISSMSLLESSLFII